MKTLRRRSWLEVLARVVADVVMINLSLGLVLFGTFIWAALHGSGRLAKQEFVQVLNHCGSDFLLLTPLCIGVFFLSGIYSHGRAYRSRFKVLVILRAVSIAYGVLLAVTYALPSVFGLTIPALFLAWLVTSAILIFSRLWSVLWVKFFVPTEHVEIEAPRDGHDRRVLVIGGAGYIGSSLLEKLLDRGYSVRLLDLFIYGEEPIQRVKVHPKLEIIRGDFRQVDVVLNAMLKMDAVVHLGAIVGDPACAIDEALTMEVNLVATRMIAEVAKNRGVKQFIFASTCSVYGASDEILNERSALKPVSLYAKTKIASEQLLLKMADERFSPTMLRFGTIYGLSGRTRFDLVANLLTAKAMIDGKITVFGADQCRPFLHVADAAEAVVRCLEADQSVTRNEIFNVGNSSQNFTLGQLGELVHRLVPTAELIVAGTDADRRNYRVDFTKIERKLGYRTTWTLEQGIRQVMDAIDRGEVEDYQHPKYSNVKHLTGYALVAHARWDEELIGQENASN